MPPCSFVPLPPNRVSSHRAGWNECRNIYFAEISHPELHVACNRTSYIRLKIARDLRGGLNPRRSGSRTSHESLHIHHSRHLLRRLLRKPIRNDRDHILFLLLGMRDRRRLHLDTNRQLGLDVPDQLAQPSLRSLHRLFAQGHLLPLSQHPRRSPIFQPELLVRPYGVDFRRLHPDASAAAQGGPFGGAFDVESGEDGVDGFDEVGELRGVVPWCGCDAETLFAYCDGGVVDRLDVDPVVG